MAGTAEASLSVIPDDPATPSIVVCASLAAYFEVDLGLLVQLIGGDWRLVDDRRLNLLPEPTRWLGRGTPLQVLLGLSTSRAVVARPDEFMGGLAGPPTLDAADPVGIDLTAPQPLQALGVAVEQVLVTTRQGWGWCQGCRNYLPTGPVSGRTGLWCGECLGRYLGIIAC
ncbi:hypothetical protein LL946_04780 [Knoellia locipacati]|uniref:hypothetical protein n=1 Tax=Knoellia locipacati TaxID=882824 RepID=UPI00384EE3E6